MCWRHTVGLLGNYSLFFLCSKLSLSFFLFILLPLFYVLCFTSSSFLLPIPRFFILVFPYSLPLFSLPYSFLPFLFFPVNVPPFAFSIFLLISVVRILSSSFFFFYSCLTFFISRLLYLRLASTVELHLSGLIGTASHRIVGFFFENRLHWHFLYSAVTIYSMYLRLNLSSTPALKF